MRRLLLMSLFGLALFSATPEAAQAQGVAPSNVPSVGLAPPPQVGVLPNYFNRQVQPLSPYLRFFAPLDPAVNYYYDVRPAVQLSNRFGPANAGGFAPVGPRQTFFPNVGSFAPLDPTLAPAGGGMSSTGHPTGFGNTQGYYPQ